jgi:hypothetical protein
MRTPEEKEQIVKDLLSGKTLFFVSVSGFWIKTTAPQYEHLHCCFESGTSSELPQLEHFKLITFIFISPLFNK